ncbi:MAG: DUF4013 domain-containing protein, partial [Chloroflexi bacterium]|nr:DUF4013 domain-containing protein [Chloroflexota bacterium]
IPIVNLFAIGYALRALKNVSDGQRPILPEWNDWGADWVKGFLSSIVAPFIYALPLLLAMIPFFIVSSATSYSYDSYSYDYSTGATALGTICTLGTTCLGVLWGLLIGLVYPAATVRYARTGEFASYFRFREIWRFIKDNLADYIVAILLAMAASLVASIVGPIACGIGIAFTSFWAYLVMAHLFGQIEGAAPVAAAPAAPSAPLAPIAPEAPSPATTYGDLETTKLGEQVTEELGGEEPKPQS